MQPEMRERVVELLRCAADLVGGSYTPLTSAWRAITGDRTMDGPYKCPDFCAARDARIAVDAKLHVVPASPAVNAFFARRPTYQVDQRARLLEAALRVEEGRWP